MLPDLSILTGNLRLSSCNLWMGYSCCSSATSSGLHHDFHDNFYCLVAGQKTFRLYAPTEAANLGIANATLHPRNGLLSYDDDDDDEVPTRADVEDETTATTTKQGQGKEPPPPPSSGSDEEEEERSGLGQGF